MPVDVDGVVVLGGVLPRVPVEDELPVVEPPHLLLLLWRAQVPLLDGLLLPLRDLPRPGVLSRGPGAPVRPVPGAVPVAPPLALPLPLALAGPVAGIPTWTDGRNS